MLKVFSSNRTEALATMLADQLKAPKRSWTEKDLVLVQSRGMERWLNLKLAEINGIAANIDFPFPKGFILKMLKAAGFLDDEELYSRETMAWQIYTLLPDLIDRPAFVQLKNYLGESAQTALRRYQLALKLADLFDNYLLFRPEMVNYWLNPQDLENYFEKSPLWDKYPWQAELCRTLFADEPQIFTQAIQQFLNSTQPLKTDLPQQIHLFAFTTLPPLTLKFFKHIGDCHGVEVCLYYLSPCNAYWADTVSEKFMLNQLLRPDPQNDEHWETGHPLLASMGGLGRDFLQNLIEIAGDNYDGDVQADHLDLDTELNLLQSLQRDLLEFVLPQSVAPLTLDANDESLLIQSCHSPMREVEVLHDRLLDFMQNDPTLSPSDILVMAPDIQTYAPYIEAVFDQPVGSSHQKLPYTVADASLLEESRIARLFFNLLNLSHSRLTATEILGLLENDCIYRQFDLHAEDLATIRQFVTAARIAWGKDAAFRQSLDPEMPAFETNSWRFGFNRLLMGYAVSEADYEADDWDIYPSDVEGHETAILGRFMHFAEALFDLVDQLRRPQPRTAAEWQTVLNHITNTFFEQDRDTASELMELRRVSGLLVSQLDKVNPDEALPLAVVMSWLNGAFNEESGAHGFLQRGITFCKLLPMRSIPAKVICILGLNDGEFPRQDRKVSFDLVGQKFRPGDRSLSKDDRYLFLEALLSARQNLYLSYIGRSIKDNEEIPPSVVISELLDYLKLRTNDADLDHLVTSHPLQAFNPAYFTGDGPLFSYSRGNALTALKLIHPSKLDLERFFDPTVKAPRAELAEHPIDFDDVLNFYKNPAAHFLKNHLHVNLRIYEEDQPDETERLEKPAGLTDYQLRNEILHQLLQQPLSTDDDSQRTRLLRQLRDRGELPVGALGETTFEQTYQQAVDFATQLVEELGEAPKAKPAAIRQLTVNGVRLTGVLNDLYEHEGIVKQHLYHFGQSNAERELQGHLKHLVASAMGLTPYTRLTHQHGSGKKKSVKTVQYKEIPATEAKDLLGKYLDLFQMYQHKPMAFFPETSKAFWQALEKESEREVDAGLDLEAGALEKAEGKWTPSNHPVPNEGEDPAFTKCFGEDFPGYDPVIRDEFCALAEVIYTDWLLD